MVSGNKLLLHFLQLNLVGSHLRKMAAKEALGGGEGCQKISDSIQVYIQIPPHPSPSYITEYIG